MSSSSIVRVLLMAIAGSIAATGCAQNRGLFAKAACPTNEREGTPPGAVLAIYYDKDGNPVPGNPSKTPAEDLHGTKDKKMCPADIEGGGGGCAPLCRVRVNGVNYCVTCPP